MVLSAFTFFHVALSLVGIGSGFVVVYGLHLFRKLSALKSIAPTQSEPPFQVTQLAGLLLFTALVVGAARKFRIDSPRMA